jgi:chromosome segregation ATPase
MSRRYYIELDPDGQHRFVTLKRSRSHHHHHGHNHHRCLREHEHCCVGKDEWGELLERERRLRAANDSLTKENHGLKCELQTVDVELRRYQGWVPNLKAQIQALIEENAALRRAIESPPPPPAPAPVPPPTTHCEKHLAEIERLRHKICRAEDEVEALKHRVRELVRRGGHSISDRIDELNRRVRDWARKFEVVDDHNHRLRRDLDRQRRILEEQHERIETYERLLIRHGIIRC